MFLKFARAFYNGYPYRKCLKFANFENKNFEGQKYETKILKFLNFENLNFENQNFAIRIL